MIALYGNQQQHVSHDAINTTGMSACYSPNPESPYGFDYPFDLEQVNCAKMFGRGGCLMIRLGLQQMNGL
jgi:hypothetical protein